jgi:hypothetical protein
VKTRGEWNLTCEGCEPQITLWFGSIRERAEWLVSHRDRSGHRDYLFHDPPKVPEPGPDAWRVQGFAADGDVVFTRYREDARLGQIAAQAMSGYARVVRTEVVPVSVTVWTPQDDPSV